ncbi:hypothetical protein HNY73_009566 [Argiope bruennichi]|uniref:Uncharacterized protein n=1 Tax=Argiope bruennichi TaxID=94029 RepID=A0A8T0FCP5_ARGBR|nr:hypothetical protein HNY73_009566 [Argiope bruennichi]
MIPYSCKMQDGQGGYSNEDFISNYNDNVSNILNLSQPISIKYSKHTESSLLPKAAVTDLLNNTIDSTSSLPLKATRMDSLNNEIGSETSLLSIAVAADSLNNEIDSSSSLPLKAAEIDSLNNEIDYGTSFTSKAAEIDSLNNKIDLTSALPSKTAEIYSLNNAVDQNLLPVANINEEITFFPIETLNTDLSNEERNINNTPLFQESGIVAKFDTNSSSTNPDVQKNKFAKFLSRNEYIPNELIDMNLLDNFKNQESDKNGTEISNVNKFYAYIANVIHNNALVEKNKFKPRTKFQPLDINEFYKLIYESKPNDVPNGYALVKNIANSLYDEKFGLPMSELIEILTAKNLNDASNVHQESDHLPSSIQYAILPYEAWDREIRS